MLASNSTAHFTYIWAIENVSSISLSRKIRSPAFSVQTIGKNKLHLEAEYDDKADNFMLYICREKNDWPESFEIEFEFSLMGSDAYATQRGKGQFYKFSSHRYGAAFNRQLPENFLTEILTVRCKIWRNGCDVSESDFCFARTRMGVEYHAFVWEIKQFSSLRSEQNRTFFLHPTSETLPNLIFTFTLQENLGKEYGRISVVRGPLMGTCQMNLGVYFLDSEGARVPSFRSGLFKVSESKITFQMPKPIPNAANFLPNDVLSLECHILMNPRPLWSRIESYREVKSSAVEASAPETSEMHFDSNENASCPSKQILRSLYEDGTLSDISLRAGSQSFSAHKNILSVRSPVFKAMFTNGMKESTAKCVDISDLNANTLNRLLLYIYTNRVEELQWEEARDLFTVADKYEVLDLRERCSDFLKANLSPSNVCSILVLADMYNDEGLRREAQDFILQDPAIFYSDAWKELKEEHAKLAFESTEQIISNLRNSGQ